MCVVLASQMHWLGGLSVAIIATHHEDCCFVCFGIGSYDARGLEGRIEDSLSPLNGAHWFSQSW